MALASSLSIRSPARGERVPPGVSHSLRVLLGWGCHTPAKAGRGACPHPAMARDGRAGMCFSFFPPAAVVSVTGRGCFCAAVGNKADAEAARAAPGSPSKGEQGRGEQLNDPESFPSLGTRQLFVVGREEFVPGRVTSAVDACRQDPGPGARRQGPGARGVAALRSHRHGGGVCARASPGGSGRGRLAGTLPLDTVRQLWVFCLSVASLSPS